MKRQLYKRGTDDTFGLILVVWFGAMAALSLGVTFFALGDGQSSEIIELCLIATVSWAALWTVINSLCERTGGSH